MSIFSSKKKIDVSKSTLSQAIMLKCQNKDFSYKSETKILTIIYEHMKYNAVKSRCQYDGMDTSIPNALFSHLTSAAGIHNSQLHHYQPVKETLVHITGRVYFCQEIDKSIEILTHPVFVTNGQRRELILELLRSVKVEEHNRLNREIAYVAPAIYADENGREFSQISLTERRQFFSSLKTMIIDHIINNRTTRLLGISHAGLDPSNSMIRNQINSFKDRLSTYNLPAFRHTQPQRVPQPQARRILQMGREPVLSEQETSRRAKLHKELALLFAHMDKVKDLSPGDKITVYEYEEDYYSREECIHQNIPMDSRPIVLEYMNESQYLDKCNAFKATFTAVLPQIHIMV